MAEGRNKVSEARSQIRAFILDCLDDAIIATYGNASEAPRELLEVRHEFATGRLEGRGFWMEMARMNQRNASGEEAIAVSEGPSAC